WPDVKAENVEAWVKTAREFGKQPSPAVGRIHDCLLYMCVAVHLTRGCRPVQHLNPFIELDFCVRDV
ncbi:MAG: hypothetical protein M1511_01240, partial [Deltaproteobacteria bacterium]|nr:hypothetical protein [Deltaproteobacteria bacterium]